MQDILRGDRLLADTAFGESKILGDRRVEMMAHHQHVEMLVDGVPRERPRRIGRGRQHILQACYLDDVGRMAAARAFGVEGMNRAALERGDGVLDEAGFVEGVGVDHHLDIVVVGDRETAIDRGGRALICASTGNTSASAAAYAARAGLPCAVVLPAGKIASGKLVQAFAHSAKIVAIDGNFDDALRIVRQLGEQKEFVIVNSINPDRIAGQKTAAFEIIDDLGNAPDFHLLPVGNAGNITAYWAGYQEYKSQGRSAKLPAVIGFQAAGAAPIFHDKIVAKPETIASAIRIGNPASWKEARAALDESKGDVDVVTDEEILAAQSWLACNEGIFIEPASAAPIAGLFKWSGKIPRGRQIVCTVTGHGLKDPDVIQNRIGNLEPVPPKIDNVRRAIGF